jgi:hypothetical protein
MKRAILAVAAGLVLWIMLISVLNRGLRLFVVGYAAAEPTLSFTLGMLVARLLIAALTSLIAGALVRWLAPANVRAPLFLGVILLIAFIPVHVRLWSLFPFWYHMVFLVTLIPLVMLGSRLKRARGGVAGAPASGART